MKYSDIEFGLARAELEAVQHPKLLTDGFLDNRKITTDLVDKHKFLVLGHKGSGKSAIAEKLRLEADKRGGTLVRVVHLADFPFKTFAQFIPGHAEAEAKYPTTWSWLILLLLLDSIRMDNATDWAALPNLGRTIQYLQSIGLIPSDDLKTLVLKSGKKSTKVQIPHLFECVAESATCPPETDLQIFTLVRHILTLVRNAPTPNRHVLIIDGLDDILTHREIQYQSISALVFEVDRLNLAFMKDNSACKVLLLCRTDLFERLPGPNKNKLRQDSAFELDWYHDAGSPDRSDLVALANLRAQLVGGPDLNLFKNFFPATISDKKTTQYLLEHTRHTPRDFIQLLNHLKPYDFAPPFTQDQIVAGISEYSKKYFLPEIRDEMVGYVSEETFDSFIHVVGSFHARQLPVMLLVAECVKRGISADDVRRILNDLYNCSAIGNVKRRDGQSLMKYYKYRNRNDMFTFEGDIEFHCGLWKALNLGSGRDRRR